MDFGEAVFQSQFIRREHAPTLFELLRSGDFGWLVGSPHPEEQRLQGDLLRDLPVALINPHGEAKTATLSALVINNTCDLQPNRSSFVTVAPASDYRAFSSYVAQQRTKESASGYLQSIQSNKVDESLFIPRCPGFESGAVVHLDRLCSMSSRVYDRALSNGQRLASFSQSGFYYLLMKMTRFLARTETSDIASRTE